MKQRAAVREGLWNTKARRNAKNTKYCARAARFGPEAMRRRTTLRAVRVPGRAPSCGVHHHAACTIWSSAHRYGLRASRFFAPLRAFVFQAPCYRRSARPAAAGAAFLLPGLMAPNRSASGMG
jgi:hypothetical protein